MLTSAPVPASLGPPLEPEELLDPLLVLPLDPLELEEAPLLAPLDVPPEEPEEEDEEDDVVAEDEEPPVLLAPEPEPPDAPEDDPPLLPDDASSPPNTPEPLLSLLHPTPAARATSATGARSLRSWPAETIAIESSHGSLSGARAPHDEQRGRAAPSEYAYLPVFAALIDRSQRG
jgi:hypothetical protein